MTVAEFLLNSWIAAASTLDLFGALGLTLGFMAGAMPRRAWILIASAGCSACFALHYWRLGAVTGAAMCGVSVLQGLAALYGLGPGRRAGWVAPLFAGSSLVAAGLTLATWQGWPSACAGAGALFATAARLRADPQAMRRLFLGSSGCWAAHNLIVGSVFGLTCDALTVAGLAVALVRAGESRPAALAA
jgi:hypothetical protein